MEFYAHTQPLPTCDVEIVPLSVADKSMPLEDWNRLEKYDVVIGSEKWLLANDVQVDEMISDTLARERQLGNISILCAMNGT